MNISYEKFKKRILEHALYVDDLSRFDNYLKHIPDKKLILKDLKEEMTKFKEMISHFNDQSVFILKFQKDETYQICNLEYDSDIEKIITQLKRILKKIDDQETLLRANRIVYGAEYEMNFNILIELEHKNFNRIHIADDLPYSLRDLGLGKMLYKNIIKKFGWISSNSAEPKPTEDSKFVWDSLRNDTDLYTCIKDKSIISLNSKLDKNILENVIRKWLKNSENYIIDSDMLKKYPDFDIS
jgi:hypothetical protein